MALYGTLIVCFLVILLAVLSNRGLFERSRKETLLGKITKEKTVVADKDSEPQKEKEKKDKKVSVISWNRLAPIFYFLLFVASVYMVYAVATHKSKEEQAVIDIIGKDHPLIEVARCVSNFRQFEKDGKTVYSPPVRGVRGIGIFQFHPDLREMAKTLGFPNLDDALQNIQFAQKVWGDTGGYIWFNSVDCWGPRVKKFVVLLQAPPESDWSETLKFPAHSSYRYESRATAERPYRFSLSYSDGHTWRGVDYPNQTTDVPLGITGELWLARYQSVDGEPIEVTVEVTVK